MASVNATARANTPKNEKELLAQLDTCVDRIRSHISDEPYITTIPQEEPKFHHYTRQLGKDWRINAPFDPSEDEQIQYQTFFYREPYSDIFERVRYSHFDRSYRPPPSPAPAPSATNTPSLGPKKKISLADYKNKKAQAGLSTPAKSTGTAKPNPSTPKAAAVATSSQSAKDAGRKTTEREGNLEKTISEEGNTRKTINEKEDTRSTIEEERNTGKTVDEKENTEKTMIEEEDHRKGKLGPDTAPIPASPQLDSAQQDKTLKRKQPASEHSTPPKKPRLSTPPSEKAAHSSAQESPRAQPLPTGRLSPLDSLYLPGRLSPTLPPQIIAALDRRRSPSISDSSIESDEPLKNVMRWPSSKHDSVLSQVNEPTTDPVKPTAPAAKDNKSLIVVLKISKKHRASFRRLVQFTGRAVKDRRPDPAPPKPANASKAPIDLEEDRRKVDARSKEASSSKISSSAKTAEKASHSTPSSSSASKRPRPSDDHLSEPLAKRKNPPSTLHLDQNPVTPLQPSFRSPALPAGANRSTQATPTHRKEMRGPSAMQRVESSDGFNPSTPTMHDHTPASKTTSASQQLTGSNLRPSPSANSARTAESQAWSAESTRFLKVATELKHAAPEHPVGGRTSSSAKDRRIAEAGALCEIESLLAFLLAFSCVDKSYTTRQPPMIPDAYNWISCTPFWRQVKSRCQPYPHLAGVVAYLGAAYNGMIMRRMSSAPPSAKTEPKHLFESVAAACKATEEASLKLPLATIKAEYPRTWATGMSGVLSTGASDKKERVVGSTPGWYEGGFTLDVGIHTDPQEAVRFARSLLTEWCAKSKEGEYTFKLKLSSG